MNVAEHLSEALVRAGIRVGFGIPGGETLTLLEAFRKQPIRFVLARHETGAGLMAEGLHHATGAPGLLVATVGPGVANCPNAVAQAALDRVPLVVVTGNVAARHTGAFTHQVFDHQALLGPLTKASYRLEPDTAAAQIEEGLSRMLDGPPGPVHFDVPLDVAEAECRHASTSSHRATPSPDPDAMAQAIERLRNAERPLVLIGLQALRSTALAPLVESLGAAALTTYKAIGALPWTHPQWVGAAGLSPKADAVVLPLVQEADVVLLAGYDGVEMRAGWLEPFGSGPFVIDVSHTKTAPPEHRTDLRLVGPVDEVLSALGSFDHDRPRGAQSSSPVRPRLSPRNSPPPSPWTERVAETRSRLVDAFLHRDDWSPAGVIAALNAAVGPDTMVTIDTGAHRILASQMWRATRPGRVLQSTGLCTMGYALPTAIGAALGTGAPTFALVGDGGFEMALGELATARDLGVDLTVVVIDDRSLALIEKKQRERGLANVGVDFGDPSFAGTDYVALAQAFGAEAARFDDAKRLEAWLGAPSGGLRLAHCPVPRRSYDGLL